jgi:AcrR family transcriptional regulator
MPKIVDRQQYRKELLSQCFDLFAENGYGSITMRQIADCLGVSTGTLYHYFPSKKALFEQLVEEIGRRDVLMAAAELEGTQTLQERMEALGRFLAKNEDYFIKLTYILMDFSQHPDFRESEGTRAFKGANELYHEAMYGLLGVEDPALAQFVLSLIDGLIIERLWGNEKVVITEQFALLGKLLTAYIEKEP